MQGDLCNMFVTGNFRRVAGGGFSIFSGEEFPHFSKAGMCKAAPEFRRRALPCGGCAAHEERTRERGATRRSASCVPRHKSYRQSRRRGINPAPQESLAVKATLARRSARPWDRPLGSLDDSFAREVPRPIRPVERRTPGNGLLWEKNSNWWNRD